MFDISDQDIQWVIEHHVVQLHPLILNRMPVKEKRKFIIICMVIHLIDPDKHYHEKELNDILKPIVDDYVMIRRYLIDYQMMKRTPDGKDYWLIVDPKEYLRFKLN